MHRSRTLKGSPSLPLTEEQRTAFGRCLLNWYWLNARDLPWRRGHDPYRTWVSEIMLQQTRVAAVLEHYQVFLQHFPTVFALALAPEEDVLARWSGLGYYRRARLLHRAARFLVQERDGILPSTAAELRKLPGIGAYTSAAIASIAFGEAVAVLDGNVERVLLRIAGRAEGVDRASEIFLQTFAQSLVSIHEPGDHNQAMMELGATVCLPRNPLCLQCPVFNFCRTRGEHPIQPRTPMRSERTAYALTTRKGRGTVRGVEVLLHRRSEGIFLMAGMIELPPLTPPPATEPMLRLRHAIVGTNYYVEIFSLAQRRQVERHMKHAGEKPPTKPDLIWAPVRRLHGLPLTGLARKVLQRSGLMTAKIQPGIVSAGNLDQKEKDEVPLLTGRHHRASDGGPDL